MSQRWNWAAAGSLAIVLAWGVNACQWAAEPVAEDKAAEKPATSADKSPAATEDAPAEDTATSAERAAALKQFDDIFTQWKQSLKSIRTLQVQYQAAVGEDKVKIERQFPDELAKAKKLVQPLKDAAERAYELAPNENKDVALFISSVLNESLFGDNYEDAARVAKLLLANNAKVERLNLLTGIAAFATNDFELADQQFKTAAESDQFKQPEQASDYHKRMLQAGEQYASLTAEYKKLWAKEQEIREREAEADDLPRIKLETTQGDIVLELFENEAPNSVANFVNLVEKGYYDGLKFHRVISGFMAQGGCPKGTGTGGPGYGIECECFRPDRRSHFRGTLSMAHAGRDTGGSQFFLTFVPTPHLDGKHTAFGRVIEGFDALSKLHRTEPATPGDLDKIIKATVVRKRDHEYKPKTIAALR